MELPRVDPVGLLELPEDLAGPPTERRRWQRWTAIAMLAVFALVTVITTAVSLGQYCLTTHGGDTRALPWGREEPPSSDDAL